jgi:hypothetical protein
MNKLRFTGRKFLETATNTNFEKLGLVKKHRNQSNEMEIDTPRKPLKEEDDGEEEFEEEMEVDEEIAKIDSKDKEEEAKNLEREKSDFGFVLQHFENIPIGQRPQPEQTQNVEMRDYQVCIFFRVNSETDLWNELVDFKTRTQSQWNPWR